MPDKRPGLREFVCLAALLMSLSALAIDSVLPALPAIDAAFALADSNQRQWVVVSLLAGLSIGQLFYGPLADAIGRRPTIILGTMLFVAGGIVCIVAPGFEAMLLGRVLQGLGAAGPRIVVVALIRDQYEGAAMARISSFVLAIFILVPAIAPLLGQSILLVADWQWIYGLMLLTGFAALGWFMLRQPETLAFADRRRLNLPTLRDGLRTILAEPVAIGGMLTSGLVFGGFVAWLGSSQQILGDLYGLGQRFPLYFAFLALMVGTASVVNSALVERLGIQRMCTIALGGQLSLSLAALLVAMWQFDGQPPLWFFMAYASMLFFVVGLLFGNLNALAMKPLGKVAGLGASVIGAGSTFVAVVAGGTSGQFYNGTVIPLLIGFTLYGGLGLLAFRTLCLRSAVPLDTAARPSATGNPVTGKSAADTRAKP